MMYTWQYAQAAVGADPELSTRPGSGSVEKLRELRAAGTDYPYDAVFLHGAVSDNQPLDRPPGRGRPAVERAVRVSARSSSRRNAEFFEYIEKHYGDKLPVYRGSAGTYWEDGAASSARETALAATPTKRWPTAAKLLRPGRSRSARRRRIRADEVNDAWRNCILYDEHTWGADCSISEPDSDFTKAQWKIKSQFAVDADQQARGDSRPRAARALASLGPHRRPGAGRLQSRRVGRGPTCCGVKLPPGLASPSRSDDSHATPDGTLRAGQGRSGLRLPRAEARRRAAKPLAAAAGRGQRHRKPLLSRRVRSGQRRHRRASATRN